MKKLFKNLFINNWKEYRKDGNVTYLSYFTRFSWFCDYGNNPDVWWNIFVANPVKNDYGTWWYKFKRTKFFGIIIIILLVKILYPYLPILSLINIVR